ncbi:cobalamin-5'-phosphate synthase [Parasphingorhabdus marina DSM 22363]|uniref:Adenosylcobinamide-GDP ribazoletransferase n=1 Tax=Parasphingorhabdus marina DSM 22363 TaxID=1123272 RepID=A0A1N6D0S4_9SPHN|nr:adenosylcobinamide-GDP ribazoletransferase [Parasphingorhabdus marina]SIN64398.1 cobalamin-5'-phosphate synthase [Parasphingorhabdus marina DSM 22363]
MTSGSKTSENLKWWMPPLLAVQFLTRIPVPGLNGLTAEQARSGLSRAVIWFPLVGALVGLITTIVLVASAHVWPRAIAVIIALAIEARLTGAFHEDAVADFCDAFGGGHDRESTQRIMKDSRIGSYGALGLILAVGLRGALLITLPQDMIIVALIASACFGRLLAVAVMALVSPVPVQAQGLARDIGGRTGIKDLLLASLLSAPVIGLFAYLLPFAALLTFALAALFLIWFRALLLRRLGGSTGDCLGFAAYVGQLILLLAVMAMAGP